MTRPRWKHWVDAAAAIIVATSAVAYFYPTNSPSTVALAKVEYVADVDRVLLNKIADDR